jgi:hypothetical protein
MSAATTPPDPKAPTIRILEQERYSDWDALVGTSPHGCIFQSSWWLQATGSPFEILVAEDPNGRLVAGIPLPRKKIAGLTLLYTPLLTPYLGPVFDLTACTGEIERLGFMRKVGEALARGIRGYDGLSYWIGPCGPDLQGFLWAGFRAELGYTFRFDPGTPVETVLDGADDAHRGEVRLAKRTGVVVERSDDIERFLSQSRLTFLRQGTACPWTDDLVRSLWRAASSRGAARLYLSRTAASEDAAALVVVKDRAASYHLLAGGDPALRAAGAGNLVTLHAISEALSEGRAYDFEGSQLRGVEWHYRHWGAKPRPIWVLERSGTLKGAVARVWRRRSDFKRRL